MPGGYNPVMATPNRKKESLVDWTRRRNADLLKQIGMPASSMDQDPPPRTTLTRSQVAIGLTLSSEAVPLLDYSDLPKLFALLRIKGG